MTVHLIEPREEDSMRYSSPTLSILLPPIDPRIKLGLLMEKGRGEMKEQVEEQEPLPPLSPPSAATATPPDTPIPAWLRGLPRAPEYRPTESEFADPIAFLSRVEREAAAFGICKVIPPYQRPSRRYVFANLNRSLVSSNVPNLTTSDSSNPTSSTPAPAAVFTTRHQELGTPRRGRPPPQVLKQVWQSGERYTLEQFEAKSRAFSKTQLSGLRDPIPLTVESLFWKASSDRPIYIEYANDVPGSGFAASTQSRRQKKRKREGVPMDEGEKTAGRKLSSSPWNLQAIARAPGSLTRFMPDDVPGVTSPMVYIGMLFSWFAWHIEDHELHSLNFLHTGAPKTWYAVPGDRAAELEEVIRVHGYGGNRDHLASLAVLGEKTTLMSPEVIVASGLPCCRLVQYPGEFVVTFPRAYHVGFSHGFNCGEAANFATPQWLKFAKEAAVRRAVMNYLPMLSHQQLLYLLAVSFISRNPRELLYGIRTSRLRDRRKEERELLVKQEFLQDMISENELLCSLLKKKSIDNAVLWEPDLLPSSTAPRSCSSGPKAPEKTSDDGHNIKSVQCNPKDNECMTETQPKCMSMDIKSSNAMSASEEKLDADDEGDLPFDLSIDSGSLTCVACGILGYPFMAILQPSRKALEDMSLADRERFKLNCDEENRSNVSPCSLDDGNSGCAFIANRPLSPAVHANFSHQIVKSHEDCVSLTEKELHGPLLLQQRSSSHSCSSENTLNPCINTEAAEKKISRCGFCTESSKQTGRGDVDAQDVESRAGTIFWNITCTFVRPRIFCLQHALEIEELLESKGGSRSLIICHSDYTKLKALAISIAEEIEFQFDCKDIPLANASKSDLHIINISIDDEGHEEVGRDWTSQMGLNMKYFAKLRKETPGDQEQPPLSFWKRLDIRGGPPPISVVPNLKWLCRKTRTPYKVVGYVSSPNATATPEKLNPVVTKTKMCTSGIAYENGENQQNFQDGVLLQPSRLQEADHVADICMCSEDNDQDKDHLIDIRIALAEYPMMHQVCDGPVSISTCDDSICSVNSHDSPQFAAVSDEFIIEQQCVQSAELSSSATASVQQFLVSESITDEDSGNHENLGSRCVTSECKDKQLQVQQDQENMGLCDNANRNLVGPYSIKGVAISKEPHHAAVSASLENEGNCAKTSNCSGTFLKTNESAPCDLPELYDPGAVLVTQESSCDEMISSVDRQFNLPTGCLASTDAHCSTEPMSIARDFLSDELQTVLNLEMPVSSINSVQVDTSHCNVKAVKLKSNDPSKLQHEYAKRDAIVSVDVQPALAMATSGENGKSNHIEPNSFDILLGALAEESKVADAPGKDEVGKASLTLMTLAGNDHSVDDATQNEIVEMAGSSVSASVSYKGQTSSNLAADKLLGIQNPEIQQERENTEGDGGGSASCVARRGINSDTPVRNQCVGPPDVVSRRFGISDRTDIICYVRRRHKRTRESELNTDSSQSCGSFVRSPCESLRPRTKPAVVEQMVAQTKTVRASAANKGKRTKVVEVFQCDLEFCDMTFESRAELRAHQRNICTDESCGKRFSSHKYLKRHQCVHSDERPFKCPWDGCGMTFKWLWAQTEHVRVHTGARPYQCLVPDCGLRFRYVSDYSRHRKKFNHY